MARSQILAKLSKADYNNIMETVLEDKSFTSDTKSLLLSMLYKVETSYTDYAMVKRNVMHRDSFIEQIIETIRYCCSTIRLVEPASELGREIKKDKIKIENKNIISYPTEYALMKAIAELIPLDFSIDNLLSDEYQRVAREGYIFSVNETITSFDGWTWTIFPESAYVLLYQNLEMLLGHEFIEKWRNGEKNFKKLQDKLFLLYHGEKEVILIEELTKIMARGFVLDFPEKASKYMKHLRDLRKEYSNMNDTVVYLNDVLSEKKKIRRAIKEIDVILSDSVLVQAEYKKENAQRPLEKKIFSIRQYVQILKNERSGLIDKLKEYNSGMKPENLLKKKENLKIEIDKYKVIEDAFNDNRTFEECVLDFQSTFLKVWEVSIDRMATKKDVIDLIYMLRYYKYLKLNAYIKDIESVTMPLSAFERKLLMRAMVAEVVTELTDDHMCNIEILSKIFETTIIDLEEISIVPRKRAGKIVLEIYDGEILDGTVDLDSGIDGLKVKMNKKIKLFN